MFLNFMYNIFSKDGFNCVELIYMYVLVINLKCIEYFNI